MTSNNSSNKKLTLPVSDLVDAVPILMQRAVRGSTVTFMYGSGTNARGLVLRVIERDEGKRLQMRWEGEKASGNNKYPDITANDIMDFHSRAGTNLQLWKISVAKLPDGSDAQVIFHDPSVDPNPADMDRVTREEQQREAIRRQEQLIADQQAEVRRKEAEERKKQDAKPFGLDAMLRQEPLAGRQDKLGLTTVRQQQSLDLLRGKSDALAKLMRESIVGDDDDYSSDDDDGSHNENDDAAEKRNRRKELEQERRQRDRIRWMTSLPTFDALQSLLVPHSSAELMVPPEEVLRRYNKSLEKQQQQQKTTNSQQQQLQPLTLEQQQDASSSAAQPKPPLSLVDRFVQSPRLHRYIRSQKIGEGTYGAVFAALDTVTDRFVALKILKYTEDSRFGGLHATVPRELLLPKASISPLIVPILDVIFCTNGECVIVMPLVEHDVSMLLRLGRLSEAQIMSKTRRPRMGLVRSIMGQLLEALDDLHRVRGVEHRDVKPNNIMVRADGIVQLCDYGWARFMAPPLQYCARDSAFVTVSRGAAGGTVVEDRYMRARHTGPPCGINYRPIELLVKPDGYYDGAAIDVYSAGCVFFELLTGRVLFAGSSDTEVAMSIRATLGSPMPDVIKLWHQRGIPINFEKGHVSMLGQRLKAIAAEPPVYELLDAMVRYGDRPSPQQLLQYEFFRGYEPVLPRIRATAAAATGAVANAQQRGQAPNPQLFTTDFTNSLQHNLPQHVHELRRALPATWTFMGEERRGQQRV